MAGILKVAMVGLIAVLLLSWLMSVNVAMKSAPLLAVTIPALDMDASRHAKNKHGWLETKLIMDCLEKNGPYMNTKFMGKADGKTVFYLPCMLPDGRVGLAIFSKDGINVTAFIPDDSTWEGVKQYILRKAARFTGPLGWDWLP